MLSRCDFVVIQKEIVYIGDSKAEQKEPVYTGDEKPEWTKTFRIGGFSPPQQGVLILNVRHLTHEEVPVWINKSQIGVIHPLGSWEVFQTGWFTQMISFDKGVLRNGDNKIHIEAQKLPDGYDNEYDDLNLKEVICFFR